MSAKKRSEHRLSGTRLGTRFSLTMSIVLALVMLAAGAFLYERMVKAAQDVQQGSFVEAVKLHDQKLKESIFQPIQGSKVERFEQDTIERIDVLRVKDGLKGWLYRASDIERHRTKSPTRYENNDDYDHGYEDGYKDGHQLFVPENMRDRAGEGLLPLILGVTLAVILVGAFVAWLIGGTVSHPLALIVEDIAQIARGNLRHRTRVRAGGEIQLLARSIDRMAVEPRARRSSSRSASASWRSPATCARRCCRSRSRSGRATGSRPCTSGRPRRAAISTTSSSTRTAGLACSSATSRAAACRAR